MKLSEKDIEEIVGQAESNVIANEEKKELEKEKGVLGEINETAGDILERAGTTTLDALLGAQEGFTFHLGKRGLAAITAALKAGDTNVLENLKREYDKALSQYEGYLQKAEERSPIAFNVGELGGGFLNPAPATLARGAVTALGATKAAQALGQVGKATQMATAGVPLLSKLPTEKSAELLGKSIVSAGESALLGGAGEAIEGKLENVPEAMALSSVAGGLFPIAGAGIQKVGKDIYEKYPTIQKAVRAFNLRKGTPTELNPEGKPVDVSTIPGQNKVFKELENTTNKVTDAAKNLVNFAKEEFNNYLNTNKNEMFLVTDKEIGQKLNDFLTLIQSSTKDPDFRNKVIGRSFADKITASGSAYMQGLGLFGDKLYRGISLEDLSDLRKILIQNGHKIDDRELKDLIFKSGGLIDTAENIITAKFPKYSTLKNNIDEAAKPAEMLMSRTVNDEGRTIFFSDLTKEQQEAKLANTAKQLLKGYYQGGLLSAEKRNIFDTFLDEYESAINKMMKDSPGFFKNLPRIFQGFGDVGGPAEKEFADILAKDYLKSDLKDPFKAMQIMSEMINKAKTQRISKNVEDLRKKARESAANLAAITAISGYHPGGDQDIISDAMISAAKGQIPKMGLPVVWSSNIAGGIVGSTPAQMYRGAGKFTKDKLQKYAEFLSKDENPVMANIGRVGLQSLNEGSVAKSVFINTLMSNPSVRRSLGIDLSKQKEEEEQSSKMPEPLNYSGIVEEVLKGNK